MSDGFPNTYFKVAPFGFGATVYDTDDLSITRGSSLILLAMPNLLKDSLAIQFPKVEFDWIQSSASELVFRAALENTGEAVTIAAKNIERPKTVKSKRIWRRSLEAASNNVKGNVSNNSLLEEAETLIKDHEIGDSMSPADIAGQILKINRVDPSKPLALTAAQCTEICEAIKSFTAAEQGGYPLDLMLFNAVYYSPKEATLTPNDAIAALDTRLGNARYKKMGCATPALADIGSLSAEKAVCQFTGIYPSGSTRRKNRTTSDNALRRLKLGRDNKKTLYASVLEEALELVKKHDFGDNSLVSQAVLDIKNADKKVTEFAKDFSQIVEGPPAGLPLSLQSNLCVLNMDGNGFGMLRSGADNIDAYRKFSAYLDILKAGLLARILIWIADDTNAMMTQSSEDTKSVARFETLLWGGDEFTFVVPSWKGWELGAVIHEAVKDWKTLDGENMSFATGLVFGPHKSPIRDLKNAAEELTDLAKSAKPNAAWQAIAYESVDRVHFSPEQYRKDWLGSDVESNHFTILASKAVSLPNTANMIVAAASNSALTKLYNEQKNYLALVDVDTTVVEEHIRHIAPAMPVQKLSNVTAELLPGGEYPLLHFAQLNLLMEYIRAGKIIEGDAS